MLTAKLGARLLTRPDRFLGMRSREREISIKSASLTPRFSSKADQQGFVPVVLRAFPTNAAALAVWEGVMRWSAKNDVSF